jgi:hypothetical protein
MPSDFLVTTMVGHDRKRANFFPLMPRRAKREGQLDASLLSSWVGIGLDAPAPVRNLSFKLSENSELSRYARDHFLLQ